MARLSRIVLQTDPIGYGDGMNMYRYVGNDPINGFDPSGLGCQAVTIVGGPGASDPLGKTGYDKDDPNIYGTIEKGANGGWMLCGDAVPDINVYGGTVRLKLSEALSGARVSHGQVGHPDLAARS